jgi:uncharacterized protein YjcR
MYEYYITPEEYERAAKYGVRPALLEVRIRSLGWKKEKAITTPPHKKKRIAKEWVELAEKNGICYSTLKYRINVLGWDPERAATQPLQDRRKQAKIACDKSRVYPKEIIELMKKNGIPYDTFRYRVRAGWSLEDAATRPIMTRRQIGLMTKDKRAWKRKTS